MMKFLNYIKSLRRVIRDSWKQRHQVVKEYCNFESEKTRSWLCEFIERYCNSAHNVAVFNIYGRVEDQMFWSKRPYKIFFTAENVHVQASRWKKYEDLFLDDNNVALSLGFDYYSRPQYLRFPYWILRHFHPSDSISDIQKVLDNMEAARKNTMRSKFCSFICRADYFGDRAKLADIVEQVAPISYAGNFRHNDDDLAIKYADDKISYLRDVQFSLCPENSNSRGYVTEKLFDAFRAGCIPIYWGSDNNPEPDIINQDAIIFVTPDGNNTAAIDRIQKIRTNPDAYRAFLSKPIFLPGAAMRINQYMLDLKEKLKEMK